MGTSETPDESPWPAPGLARAALRAACVAPTCRPHCAARPASAALFHQGALVKTLWDISLITATGGEPRNVSPQTEQRVVGSEGIVKRSFAGALGLLQLSFGKSRRGEPRMGWGVAPPNSPVALGRQAVQTSDLADKSGTLFGGPGGSLREVASQSTKSRPRASQIVEGCCLARHQLP